MRIFFETKKVTRPNYLPKLKQGVEVFEIGANKIFVGNLKNGIELENIPISLIRSFNGRRTLQTIVENSLLDSNLIDGIIDLLSNRKMIDIYPTRLVYEERTLPDSPKPITSANSAKVFESDIAHRDFEQRVISESSVTTWRDEALDGGRTRLSERQRFSIKILGDEEMAIALYFLLASSGFTQLSLEIEREVQMDDLRSGIFNVEDIGISIRDSINKAIYDRRLFKYSDEEIKQKSNLVLFFGKPGDKLIQEWMSNEIPHLVIESIAPNFIVGPIVLPGASPCLNCVSLSDTKILRNIKQISAFQRPALAALNWIIAYLALAIAEFADGESSPLIGSAKVFDVTNPNLIRDIKYPRHPTCGCNWLK